MMEDFTASVSTASRTADRAFTQRGLDAGLADLRRSVLAQQSGLYALEERCAPLEPSVVDLSDPPPDFENICRLAPKVFDPATAGLREASIELPEGDPLVEAANARRLMRALEDYAIALQEVLTTDTRAETAAAAASALDALGEFSQLGNDGRRRRFDGPRLFSREGQDLAARATSELLEAYRYRLLQSVVTQADRPVQDAARVVAVWYNREVDRANIAGAYARLEAAIDAAEPGRPDDLARVEAAYEAAQTAEDSAGWRVFWNIGVAHAAIADSLGSPRDFEALSAANTRIFDLADSVKAFQAQR